MLPTFLKCFGYNFLITQYIGVTFHLKTRVLVISFIDIFRKLIYLIIISFSIHFFPLLKSLHFVDDVTGGNHSVGKHSLSMVKIIQKLV